jgi:hypothetical protein
MGKRTPKAALPPPYALALIVCDAIWRDPATGKHTILGCFSTITAQEFPCTHPVLSVYAAITDGHGTVPIALRLVDVDDEEDPVFESSSEIAFPDPRTVVELAFGATNITFPHEGEYRLQLRSGSALLMERRILLAEAGRMDNEEA